MTNHLNTWKVRGPVRTLRKEHAEWDPDRAEWRAPRGFTTATFRPDGQTSETEWHSGDGSAVRTVYVYDDAGRLIEEQSRRDDGAAWGAVYSYDAAGRLAGRDVVLDGRRRKAEAREYDDAGRQKTSVFLPTELSGGSLSIGTEGLEEDEVSFHEASGLLIRRVVFSRDPEGRPLTEVISLGAENVIADLERRENGVEQREQRNQYDYRYDSQGNWTERIVSYRTASQEDFRRSNVERRTITYYGSEGVGQRA